MQRRILELLHGLRDETGMALLLVSHDSGRIGYDERELGALPERELRAVRREFSTVFQDPLASVKVSDRVAVMRAGRFVGVSDDLFDAPSHAYTRELLAAVPGRGKLPDFVSGDR
ncbi:hypothetical protein GCM10027589_38100 [Actinocorallia lasiicapitis]